MGGTKRFYVRPARDQKGQQDAIYQLIDPKTGAPYTNATIVAALKERAAEQPALAEMIAADIAAIERKAKENPDAKYEMRCRGKTAQEATRRAKGIAAADRTHGGAVVCTILEGQYRVRQCDN